MKIRPNSLESQADILKLDAKERLQKKDSQDITKKPAEQIGGQSGDETKISTLAAALHNQLNPAQLLEERKAKIANIKEQIKNGTYNPPLADVAQALAEEISSEILSVGGLGGEN